jgi:hypothetical protein
MKLFTIVFVLLLGFLAACSSNNELSDVEDFDMDLLTRKEGWQIDSVRTDQLGQQMIRENQKWEKEMKEKHAKNKAILQFVEKLTMNSALTALGFVETFFGKDSKAARERIVYFKQDTSNYITMYSEITKKDTVRFKLTTYQNHAAFVSTNKNEESLQSIQIVKTLTDDEFVFEFAFLAVPKDSLDPIYKLSDQERHMPYWRLCFKPKK